jgi:hypothetical protein
MWCHSSSKGKGKCKQGDGSSSSLQTQSGTSASLFALIVSFPFIFIYTCSFEFIAMFYLIYVLFLFPGHSGHSAVTGAALHICTARSSTQLSCSRWLGRPRRRLSRSKMSCHPRLMMTRRVHHRGEASSRNSR